MPEWDGNDPAAGTLLVNTCNGAEQYLFVPNPAPGARPRLHRRPPRRRIRRCWRSRRTAELTVPNPVAKRSPAENNSDPQYGGLPYTWVDLWTCVWAGEWQSVARTVELRGVSATVTATPTALVFDPGDGSAPVTCDGPGRPWTEADGSNPPSAGGCGYMYRAVTPDGPVDGDDVDPVVGGLDQQRRRGRDLPGADHAVVVVLSGGTDSGGDQVKTPTLTVNGADRQPVSTNGSDGTGGPPLARTPLPTRQRRPGWTALGAVLVIGIGAAFGYLYSHGRVEGTGRGGGRAGRGRRGDRPGPICRRWTWRGTSPRSPARTWSRWSGERAAVALLPGTLLQRSMVTDADPIPAGMAQVGVAVKGGQLPADGLAPGDRVQVLRLPGQVAGAGNPAAPAVLVDEAVVFAAASGPDAAGDDVADPGGAGGGGAGGGGGERGRCGGGGEGAGVVIVSVCADKGSPGVTTLATVLGLVWPGPRVVRGGRHRGQ